MGCTLIGVRSLATEGLCSGVAGGKGVLVWLLFHLSGEELELVRVEEILAETSCQNTCHYFVHHGTVYFLSTYSGDEYLYVIALYI